MTSTRSAGSSSSCAAGQKENEVRDGRSRRGSKHVKTRLAHMSRMCASLVLSFLAYFQMLLFPTASNVSWMSLAGALPRRLMATMARREKRKPGTIS